LAETLNSKCLDRAGFSQPWPTSLYLFSQGEIVLSLNALETLPIKPNQTSVSSLEVLRQYVSDFDQIEQLAVTAFQNKGGEAWQKIQFLLFDLNLRLIREGFGLGTARLPREWEMRNLIEQIEQKFLDLPLLAPELDQVERFMPWLKEQISQHRVNHHPLFTLFDQDDLSDEELRYFLSNYRVNMQRFHLHVAAYSLIVPFPMREELYHNLHDEFGQGDFSQAHPNLFEPLIEHFGGAREEDINPETCNLLNTKINLCWFADGLHYGMGGMGALELSIPLQQRRVFAHFHGEILCGAL
jgi:hypothetical protein